ncbi:uncharacterized protein LOC132165021 [Corylus avellana]|uniref:uncharacterized protein LOC132165021 n=1 Tax=Corylus avellana TaxID=13451 RepID=UPI00286ABF42|nr:uncharacterized protein LOC132165021 [Corylus avellana]
MGEQDPLKTLRELYAPMTTTIPSCIVLPATNATHFDLKLSVINALPSFKGLENEDPYVHVKSFLELCDTFKFQNFADESVRLWLFSFSLHDKAKFWLHSNMPGSFTSWEMMQSKFYNKFFPISRINDLRQEINSFRQEEGEKFSESWEKFKELTMKCPPHGFETWRIVHFFYKGLTPSRRNLIESMNGGGFLNLTWEEAYRTLGEIQRAPLKTGGLNEVKDDADIRWQLKDIMRKVDAIALNKPVNTADTCQVDVCTSCDNAMHFTQNYPSLSIVTEYPMEQVNAFNEYRKLTSETFAETYNPRWQNHPNFSWKQNQPPNQGGTTTQAQNQFQLSHLD